MTGQCAHVTAFERCDCRRRTTLHFLDAEVRRAAASVQRWRWATNGHGRGRAFILGTMKGFGKIAILFGLLGGVMAYFIFPVQFTRSRALSPGQADVVPPHRRALVPPLKTLTLEIEGRHRRNYCPRAGVVDCDVQAALRPLVLLMRGGFSLLPDVLWVTAEVDCGLDG